MLFRVLAELKPPHPISALSTGS